MNTFRNGEHVVWMTHETRHMVKWKSCFEFRDSAVFPAEQRVDLR